ncbi:MAG: hypothetical protein COB04_07025 [Gammaproteobacteria bacterium]|nr:MAG: hypothetical protein COB04_07025 [Gammaproteobacteria bacterium]
MLPRIIILMLAVSFSPFARSFDYSLSGFLSLSAGILDEEGYLYADIDDSLSFNNDTILGGQISGQFTDNFSATIQVIARGYSADDSDNYKPAIDWLYLTYDITPELRVRAGRMATPYYLVSEYIEIGAAYPWIRPPFEVYDPSAAPLKSFNGIDAVLRSNWKDWFIISQFIFGQEENSTFLYEINIHRIAGLNLSFSKNDFSIRLAHFVSDVSLSVFLTETFLNLFRTDNPTPVEAKLFDLVDSKHVKHFYSSIGVNWDNDTWFVYSEYNQATSEAGFTPTGEGMYLTVGYRIGKFSPYLTRADFRLLLGSDLKKHILNNSSELPFLGPLFLNPIEDNKRYQRSIALGVRYDITNAMSLKFEALNATSQRGSVGLFTSKDSSITFAPPIRVYSLALDIVF